MKVTVEQLFSSPIPRIEDEPPARAGLMEDLLLDANGQEDQYLAEIAKAEAGETVLDYWNQHVNVSLYPDGRVTLEELRWSPEDLAERGPPAKTELTLTEAKQLILDWLAAKKQWRAAPAERVAPAEPAPPLPPLPKVQIADAVLGKGGSPGPNQLWPRPRWPILPILPSLRHTAQGNYVLEPTRSAPDSHGVYEAICVIKGVKRTTRSTFFPRHFTPEQVETAIEEAYRNQAPVEKGPRHIVRGKCSAGLTIQLVLDEQAQIRTAYPIREGTKS